MELVNVMKALGEPTRLRITMLLLDKTLCGYNIEHVLDLSQTNVSRHIAKLKQAGIVAEEKSGQRCHFSISAKFRNDYAPVYQFLLEQRATDEGQYKLDEACYQSYDECGCEDPNCTCHVNKEA